MAPINHWNGISVQKLNPFTGSKLPNKFFRLFLVAILCLGVSGLVAGLLVTSSRASNPDEADEHSEILFSLQEDSPSGNGPWVVRAYFTDRKMVDMLASRLEPWEVHHDLGYLVVAVDQPNLEWLQGLGFRIEIDHKLTSQLFQPSIASPGQVSGIPGYACYRTVEETYTSAQNLAATYPTLATWQDIGDTWEKTTPLGLPGYDLRVLRLTNSLTPGPKPKLFVMSSMHAREYAPAELNTRFAEYLLQNYNINPDITWLLDYHEIHLLLQANPDGRKIAETAPILEWRKNTDNDDGCENSNLWGTDLNRNFSFLWGGPGSSPNSCDEIYRGPFSSSEPETQAVQNYANAQFPDQREADPEAAAPITTTGIFLDLHSYGGLVLWPWGYTPTPPPNGTALQTLGRKFAYFNFYEPDQAYGLYPTNGTTDDYAYGELGLAAYTFEVGTLFYQDCSTFENSILPTNLPALLYAAKATRAPYLLPSGPDALSLSLSKTAVDPGQTVTITASLNDTRYNQNYGTEPIQVISTAQVLIDTPPWITATIPISITMTAQDGAFDETIEGMRAVIDTTELPVGRHFIYVHGQDAGGNWGPVSAVFLYILGPEKRFFPLVVR